MMAFEEKFDPAYWERAWPMLSEGFCPDCEQPIVASPRRVVGAGGERMLHWLVCEPCGVEWVPRSAVGGGAGWVRFPLLS